MTRNRYALSQGILAAKVLAAAKLSGAVLNLVVQLVLIRVLVADDYAVFLLSSSFATVLAVVTMLGVDRVVYRHVPNFVANNDYQSIGKLFGLFLVARLMQTMIVLVFLAILPHEWLPLLFSKTLSGYWIPLILFCSALSITDSLAIYANSLGLQKKQSASSLAAVLTRASAILFMVFIGGNLSLDKLLWWFVATEIAYLLVLASVLIVEFRAGNTMQSGVIQHGESYSQHGFLAEGVETQISYLLRLPFLGSSLRLLVAVFASPAAVAAFGFFQTMADRLYQFLPLILFKGIVEPGLSADYQRTGDPQRIATALSLLLRLNLAALVPAGLFLIAGQETFATLLAGNRYASYWHFAPLALLLVVAQFSSEMLWTGLNPMGDVRTINRIWRWFCVIGILMLCAGVLMTSIEALIFACVFPNFAVIVWLRYATRHPLLKSRWSREGFVSIGKSAIVATTIIFVAHLTNPTPIALGISIVAGAIVYLLLLKWFGLFSMGEVGAIGEVAPGAARVFRMFVRGGSA